MPSDAHRRFLQHRERTALNLFLELVEFLHFSVVQHFSPSVREHAGKRLLQLLICASL